MDSKPVIAIVASQTKDYARVATEPRRLFELASRVFSDQAYFLLVGCEDFQELADGRLGVLKGVERGQNSVHTISFQEALAIDYFVKRDRGQESLVDETEIAKNMPRVREGLTKELTTYQLIVALHKHAQAAGIPTNKSSGIMNVTQYKAKTDRFLRQYQEECKVHIPRVAHNFVKDPQRLVYYLTTKNASGRSTVIKPNSGKQGNGIVIVKSSSPEDLEGRLTSNDIAQVVERLRAGWTYVVCEYLEDPFLIDGRKAELRLNVVPFRREDGSVDVHYCGSTVWVAPEKYSVDQIEQKGVTLGKGATERSSALDVDAFEVFERSDLYSLERYAALMESAKHVTRALFKYANETAPTLPQSDFLAYDYLIRASGEPLFLEANSNGVALNVDNVEIRKYQEEHLVRTLIPEMIYQASRYKAAMVTK